MTAFETIEAQQRGKENTPAWMVGQQLKDIIRREPWNEALLAQDLAVPEMSLEKAAGQIKAWADKQPRKGNCVCVPPNVAEDILRKFYGLREGPEAGVEPPERAELLDLSSFL